LGCGNQEEATIVEPADTYIIEPSDGELGTSDLTDGLVGYWPFSGNAEDQSGNSNHGTAYGASLTTDRCGNPNSAYGFDGEGDYIEVGHDVSLNFGTGDFTICCWVYLSALPTRNVPIIVKRGSAATGPEHGDNYGYTVALYADSPPVRPELVVSEAGVGCWPMSEEALETDRWYFLAGVRHEDILSLYVDGELKDEVGPCTKLIDNEVSLTIGAKIATGDERYLNGSMDDVRIYNRALSEDEILALFEENPCEIDVVIDIKPGSDQNPINPRSRGVIPVAILTTSVADGDQVDFDATTVDPLSVEFGPDGAMAAHGRGHIEDADDDGDMDLILHFRTQETGLECGSTEANLTGETYEGQAIMGSDSIQTVGCEGKAGPSVVPN
jgi:hypothetical protein